MPSVRYGQIIFDSDFKFGTDAQNGTIRFSRAERLLLAKFTRSPGAILRRDDLLDVVSGPSSDASDRNIDFVINRLRRKLGDSARSPSYIQTQYGEGYVWIAAPVQSEVTEGAFLVVGPVRGLRHIGPLATPARAYAEELRRNLDRQTAARSRVVLDENCPPAKHYIGAKPQFAVELNFVRAGNRLDCAMALKAYATGQIIRLSRHVVVADDPGETKGRETLETEVNEIAGAIWDALTARGTEWGEPSTEPLAVRMHNAAMALANTDTWMESMRRLRARLDDNPQDHQARLMLATCIHSKYVQSGPMSVLAQQDLRVQDEDEIERNVLASLPHVQDNPIFRMAAGKLLYFIDRGHRPLAIQLAEEAFNSSTALATSFAILGQMRANEGDIETAVSLLDQGLELCEHGSEFELYLLVLKTQALLAAGDRDVLEPALEIFYAKRPNVRGAFAIFYTETAPDRVAPEAIHMLERMSATFASAMLVWLNYIVARLYRLPEHRENILRPVTTLMVERFGIDVVPEEVRQSAPDLIASFAGRRRAR